MVVIQSKPVSESFSKKTTKFTITFLVALAPKNKICSDCKYTTIIVFIECLRSNYLMDQNVYENISLKCLGIGSYSFKFLEISPKTCVKCKLLTTKTLGDKTDTNYAQLVLVTKEFSPLPKTLKPAAPDPTEPY